MEPKIDGKAAKQSRAFRSGMAGLYFRNMSANLFSFITIFALNFFTPLEFFKENKIILLEEKGFILFFLVYPLVMILIFLIQFQIQKPVSTASQLMWIGKDIPDGLKEKALKRLINLPLILTLINVLVYLVAPLFVILAFRVLRDTSATTCLFLFFRSFMIGLISAGLSFFLLEEFSRKHLIPRFFPKGRLATIPGTVKISILRRIRLLNLAGTLNPMLLILVTLLFIWMDVKGSFISAPQLAREIFLFTLVLSVIFTTLALRLNVLVGNSILEPIEDILNVVEKLKVGRFDQQIKVLSNDEIGILGDVGNDMIHALADRERIKDTFGKYVTPEIRDQILAGNIPLNGERTEATLLFSDLRNFTTYVEENDPEEAILSMRAYFTSMQRAIRLHEGLVLQYVGDEIEAVFGVPLKCEGHADQAIRAALEMRKALENLNNLRIAEGKLPFVHGIGICTGEVLAGNTGSEDRLSYALIGNTVNLASRMQNLTKSFHCDILISEETAKRMLHPFKMKEQSPQHVKGYSRPVTVYQVM